MHWTDFLTLILGVIMGIPAGAVIQAIRESRRPIPDTSDDNGYLKDIGL